MALKIVEDLIRDFNSSGINYCHWKSNEHLKAAVNGDTDLDILFDESQKEDIIRVLEKHKFHLFEAVWYRKYNGIVDYIGFDNEEGKVVHVHTHFNLDIGEVGIKSYRLPWEEIILNNKIFDEDYNIYKSSPEIEYLLLVVRTAFKYDRTKQKSNKSIAKHFNIEASWLYNQIDFSKLIDFSSQLLDNPMADLIKQIRIGENYDEKLFVPLKKLLKKHFSQERIITKQRVTCLKLVIFLKKVQIKLGGILGFKVNASKRSLPHEGVILSLMGPDGAGKSTQTKEVTKELSKKIDVLFMYMGSGDGPRSLHRKLISSLFSFASNLKPSKNLEATSSLPYKEMTNSLAEKSYFKQLALSVSALSLAIEKKRRLNRIGEARKAGVIVICDRYPQTLTLGYNDGPKLYENFNSSNKLLKAISRYEFSCYKLAEKVYPNLVIKLTGSLKELHFRRPEMSIEEINKKQNGILELRFGDKTKVVNIDIDKPIYQIKGDILTLLSEQI